MHISSVQSTATAMVTTLIDDNNTDSKMKHYHDGTRLRLDGILFPANCNNSVLSEYKSIEFIDGSIFSFYNFNFGYIGKNFAYIFCKISNAISAKIEYYSAWHIFEL